MDQNLFNSIQNNFKNFLSKKDSRPQSKKLVTEQIISEEQSPIELIGMEKTYGFGSDDCEIGYKMMVIDKYGRKSYKILPPR